MFVSKDVPLPYQELYSFHAETSLECAPLLNTAIVMLAYAAISSKSPVIEKSQFTEDRHSAVYVMKNGRFGLFGLDKAYSRLAINATKNVIKCDFRSEQPVVSEAVKSGWGQHIMSVEFCNDGNILFSDSYYQASWYRDSIREELIRPEDSSHAQAVLDDFIMRAEICLGR